MDQNQENKLRQVFTLSQITDSIARMFDKFYQNPYWIKAEISALNLYPSSGHCFPLMVEKSEGKVKAQLKAIIWKDDLFYISRKFEETTKEPLAEGLNIMFLAYIKFTSTYGLTLQIIDIEPLYTLGEMARDKISSINQLKAEGVFLKNKSIPLPVIIKRIAVISVASSKGYNDLLVTLQNNIQGYKTHVELFPAVMQGKGAVETMARQLRKIKVLKNEFDIVVIVRGGGDDVGLSCYDDVNLAREVALFPLPVITGIGHSTNETVVEMVACVSKITPTDVAHFILSSFREQEVKLNTIQQTLSEAIQGILHFNKVMLNEKLSRLNYSTSNYLNLRWHEIRNLIDNFSDASSTLIFQEKMSINRYEMVISKNPGQIVNQEKSRVFNIENMLKLTTRHYLSLQKNHLDVLDHGLMILSPQHVLKRGFAIVRNNGKSIQMDDINSGDLLDIETLNYHISSTVNQIRKK